MEGDHFNLPQPRNRASSPPTTVTTPPITPQRAIHHRLTTPPSTGGSRRSNPNTVYSDRFIPSRTTTNLEEAFDILGNKYNQKELSPIADVNPLGSIITSSAATTTNNNTTSSSSAAAESQLLMNNLLRSELLGQTIVDFTVESRLSDGGNVKSPTRRESGSTSSNLFKYRLSQGSSTTIETSSTMGGVGGIDDDGDRRSSHGMDIDGGGGGFGLTGSPATGRSSYLSPGKKPTRKIPKAPFKILDAPSLQDDYYLNLVDWSHHNVLSVALCSSVYLWSACTSKVNKLCDFGSTDIITSIAWALSGNQIAVGMNSGKIQIWDSAVNKMVRELHSHESRVGALAWNSSLLASGSRDRSIYLQDIRVKSIHRSSFGSSVPSSSGNPGPGNSFNPTTPSELMNATLTSTISQPRLSLPSMIDTVLPLGDSTASNSDDTFIFSDALLNLAGPRTTPSVASNSAIAHYLSPPRSRSSLLLSTQASPNPMNVFTENTTSPALNGSVVRELNAHKQEVCGLRWSFDEKMLASGGNDNKLFVWEPQIGNSRRNDPVCRFEDHTAAVKAVAWSPHQQGLLASGGGTADRHIRFWNASTSTSLHKVDTGSQVCNLMWSRTVNEIVSTHGYSLNQVIIWKYPSMQKLATLSGHTLRVLYLAMSPDGQTIVTGAGDETLRFWNVFPGPRNRSGFPAGKSVLTPSGSDIR